MRWSASIMLAMIAALACASTLASGACLVTPAELQKATGRAFGEGEAGKDALSGEPLCHYAEKEGRKRKLTLGLTRTNARQQFESRMRLLNMGGKPIDLKGIGENAYFNGTAAGVLAGARFISVTNLRRGSQDPAISSEQVVELLQAALQRAK